MRSIHLKANVQKNVWLFVSTKPVEERKRERIVWWITTCSQCQECDAKIAKLRVSLVLAPFLLNIWKKKQKSGKQRKRKIGGKPTSEKYTHTHIELRKEKRYGEMERESKAQCLHHRNNRLSDVINFLPLTGLYSSGGWKGTNFFFYFCSFFAISWFRSPLIFFRFALFFGRLFFIYIYVYSLSMRAHNGPILDGCYLLFYEWLFKVPFLLSINRRERERISESVFCVRSTNKLRFAHITSNTKYGIENVLNGLWLPKNQ